MLDPLFESLAGALAFLYKLWPSYGGSIVLFTLVVMLFTSPLSIKSTRSMIRMQRLQPEMKRLQALHKGDKETLNREMMAFYQANNVNPLTSCLPMLLQAPVFFVLFRILRGLTGKVDAHGLFEPKYLSHDSALYKALSSTSKMMSAGLDLSRSATKVLATDGLVTALPFFVLIAAVGTSQWYQQRQISGRNTGAPVNPQQQMITKVMPLMIPLFAIAMPAGVVIYMVVSNLVRVGQQALVTQLEFRGKEPPPRIAADAPPKPPPSPNSSPKAPKKAPPTKNAGNGKSTYQTGRVTAAGQPQHRRRKRK